MIINSPKLYIMKFQRSGSKLEARKADRDWDPGDEAAEHSEKEPKLWRQKALLHPSRDSHQLGGLSQLPSHFMSHPGNES